MKNEKVVKTLEHLVQKQKQINVYQHAINNLLLEMSDLNDKLLFSPPEIPTHIGTVFIVVDGDGWEVEIDHTKQREPIVQKSHLWRIDDNEIVQPYKNQG